MTDTALLAVLLASIAGVVAGRAWAAALSRGTPRERGGARNSPHYARGLHHLASGEDDLALSELAKVVRQDGESVEVQQILGDLYRAQGHVERAIQTHQSLIARADLSRAERAQALASLAADFRQAGFLDRASRAFDEVLHVDPKSIEALAGLQRLHEDQRQWREAYEVQTRLSRLRKTDDSLVLGYIQAEMGREAAAAGLEDAAERAFRTALSLDRRVVPAHLGLAALHVAKDPRRAVAHLEEVVQGVPERAYLAFDAIARAYAALGEPSRFAALCEHIIGQDPQDWRARVALARQLRAEGRLEEAHGLILRAVEANPQVLMAHLEMWRTLELMGGLRGEAARRYLAGAEQSVFYRDPHVCTVCRYRADDMLWRCPHCHRWNTFVEERVAASR